MRIIKPKNGFIDYYDGVSTGFGVDPKLHYVRKEEFIDYRKIKNKLPVDLTEDLGYTSIGKDIQRCDLFLVGFCGRIYPYARISFGYFISKLVTIHPKNKNKEPKIVKQQEYVVRKTSFCYSWQEILDIPDLIIGKYEERRVKKFFSQPPVTNDKIFIELAAPVFKVEYDREHVRFSSTYIGSGKNCLLTTNICLKDIEFYKVVDAFTAFQDLSTYLGNTLVKQDNPDEISDKYKILQHGFDYKHSFRKPKEA